jgi:hypothetical protein
MAGPVETMEGIVLLRDSSGDSWDRVTLFSPENGILPFLQRRSKKAGTPTLDLFDRIAVVLERRDGSTTRFSREIRVLRRLTGLGLRYDSLRESCQFARFLIDNPVHEESRQEVYDLLEQALAAWERGDREDIVAFKSLFVFARGEGYAVKEDWWQRLPTDERDRATRLLNRPTERVDLDRDVVSDVRRSLEHYLQHFTEIRVAGQGVFWK